MRKYKIAIGLIVLFLVWLNVGLAEDAWIEESYIVIFLKKEMTLKLTFINPLLTEADLPSIQELPQKTRSDLAEYCRYRFGIINASDKTLEECASRPFLSEYWFLNIDN
ncbi:hypothetical protein [Methylovorus sp. MP688]|uniref:hypothetical protein n=1 Tax=Methylovorus sp. (strain MP688) TaxID=887061 RepID=UPI00067686CD|nr:hypothetical protein [Methylovorus sp. MP688]